MAELIKNRLNINNLRCDSILIMKGRETLKLVDEIRMRNDQKIARAGLGSYIIELDGYQVFGIGSLIRFNQFKFVPSVWIVKNLFGGCDRQQTHCLILHG